MAEPRSTYCRAELCEMRSEFSALASGERNQGRWQRDILDSANKQSIPVGGGLDATRPSSDSGVRGGDSRDALVSAPTLAETEAVDGDNSPTSVVRNAHTMATRPDAGTAIRSAGSDVGGDRRERQSDYSDLICSYDWPCDRAVAIVYGPTSHCPNGESTGRTDVTSTGGHAGLFQVSPSWAERFGYRPADLYSPEVNTAVAYEIFELNGRRFAGQWSCAEFGW